ncbi:MAG: hypothetical protein M1524_03505 [Patescibacteria group bacterium]|nr:hypothetical protein [Patescibacteria group bacterium]
MSDIGKPEVLAGAVLGKESTIPVASPFREDTKRLREEYTSRTPRSMLESWRSRRSMEQRGIDVLIDQNIGTERNPDGTKKRKPGSDTEKRFKEAQKYSSLAKDFLERGYDSLGDPQKTEVRKFVELTIKAWPEGSALFSGMTDNQKKATIEDILKDPSYVSKLRGVFEGAIDSSKTIPDIAPDLALKFDEAKKREKEKQLESSEVQRNLTKTNDELAEFDTGGRKSDRLEAIEKDLPELTVELEDKENKFDELKDEIKYLEQTRRTMLLRGVDTSALDTDLIEKNGQLRELRRDTNKIKKTLTERDSLQQEKEQLKQKRQQLEIQRTKLDDEVKSLTKERINAQAEVASAQIDRSSQEEDFVDNLRGVFSEASMQYLEEKIIAMEEVQRQFIEEEKAKTTDPAEKAILDSLLKRWDSEKQTGVFHKRTIREFNEHQIKEDFDKLMTSGPNEIMKDILMKGGLTEDEANAKLADPEFLAKMQPQVVERLITRRIQTGALREDQARMIIESDWGKGMIENAIKNKKEVKDALDKLRSEGVLNEGVIDWFKKKSGGSILSILLLLMGTALIGVPIYKALKNEIGK